MKRVEIKPIEIAQDSFEKVEKAIRDLIRKELYVPLLAELGVKSQVIKNSPGDDLIEAIRSGRLYFYRGKFKGRFNSSLSAYLRRLGASWDRTNQCFSILYSKLPRAIRQEIDTSASAFEQAAKRMDKKLSSILPEEIADKLKIEQIFDQTLWKVEKDYQKSINGLVIAPKFSPEQRRKIIQEYTTNMKLDIKTWMEKEIIELRKKMEAHILSGQRYEGMVKTIEKRYGVTQAKANFLAGQETRLLVSKYRELRYRDAGADTYRWKCVVGSPDHPVRPAHKKLDGKIISWSDPPIVSEPGEKVRRAHANCDFNCRCFPIPIVKF